MVWVIVVNVLVDVHGGSVVIDKDFTVLLAVKSTDEVLVDGFKVVLVVYLVVVL